MLSIVQDRGRHPVFRTLIPGSGVPEWFNHQKDIVFEDTSGCGCWRVRVLVDYGDGWKLETVTGEES